MLEINCFNLRLREVTSKVSFSQTFLQHKQAKIDLSSKNLYVEAKDRLSNLDKVSAPPKAQVNQTIHSFLPFCSRIMECLCFLTFTVKFLVINMWYAFSFRIMYIYHLCPLQIRSLMKAVNTLFINVYPGPPVSAIRQTLKYLLMK